MREWFTMRLKRAITISSIQLLGLLTLIIELIIISMGRNEILILIPLCVACCLTKGFSSIELKFGMLLGFVLLALVSLNIIEYPLFPQAATLYYSNENVIYWFQRGNEHAIRLFIAYPGVLISNWFGVGITRGVTIYSSALLLLISIFMMQVLRMNHRENHVSAALCCLVIIVLSLVMNGRLIFSFFGITLLVLYEVKYSMNETSMLSLQIMSIIALLFTMVSSGTMIVAFVYIILIFPYRWKKMYSQKEKIAFLAILFAFVVPLATKYLPYLVRMINRNVQFFGGGFHGMVNMMRHGLGKILYTDSSVLILFIVVFGTFVVIFNIYLFNEKIVKTGNRNLPLFLITNICVYGSIFGRSTGLAALIPFTVLIICRFNLSKNGSERGPALIWQK